jgi:hypothetical protein
MDRAGVVFCLLKYEIQEERTSESLLIETFVQIGLFANKKLGILENTQLFIF